MMKCMCILVAIGLSVARFAFDAHPMSTVGTYQAAAHIFVGLMIGAWYVGRREYLWAGVIALGITAVEIVAAVVTRL